MSAVYLLTVEGEGHGTAWLPSGPGAPGQLLGRHAVEAWRDADLVARVCVPLSAGELEPPPGARLAASTATVVPRALDGRSFGLAFLVIALGKRLEIAPLVATAATGEVHTDGSVHGVEGIAEKMAAVLAFNDQVKNRGAGEAIRLVVVAPDDVEEARAVVAAHGVTVHGVGSAGEAVEKVFAEAGTAREEALLAERPEAAAERLFELAIGDNTRFLPWQRVAELAGSVLPRLSGSPRAFRLAAIARDIGTRHHGRPTPLTAVTWPEVLAEPASLRFKLAAHFVQGAADGVTTPWAPVADQALLLVGASRGEGEARVLGAVGRLCAAWGAYADACQHLRAAVTVWRDAFLLPESSIPACEWLRAARLWGQPAEVALARDAVIACSDHPNCSPISRRHLALALGRDAALAGDTAGTQGILGTMAGATGPLGMSARRWLALAGASPPGPLAGVDQELVALAAGHPPGPALQSAAHAPDWNRILGFAPPEQAWRHWRY